MAVGAVFRPGHAAARIAGTVRIVAVGQTVLVIVDSVGAHFPAPTGPMVGTIGVCTVDEAVAVVVDSIGAVFRAGQTAVRVRGTFRVCAVDEMVTVVVSSIVAAFRCGDALAVRIVEAVRVVAVDEPVPVIVSAVGTVLGLRTVTDHGEIEGADRAIPPVYYNPVGDSPPRLEHHLFGGVAPRHAVAHTVSQVTGPVRPIPQNVEIEVLLETVELHLDLLIGRGHEPITHFRALVLEVRAAVSFDFGMRTRAVISRAHGFGAAHGIDHVAGALQAANRVMGTVRVVAVVEPVAVVVDSVGAVLRAGYAAVGIGRTVVIPAVCQAVAVVVDSVVASLGLWDTAVRPPRAIGIVTIDQAVAVVVLPVPAVFGDAVFIAVDREVEAARDWVGRVDDQGIATVCVQDEGELFGVLALVRRGVQACSGIASHVAHAHIQEEHVQVGSVGHQIDAHDTAHGHGLGGGQEVGDFSARFRGTSAGIMRHELV